MAVLITKPFLSERPWGGSGLSRYGYDLPADTPIGEAWLVSAHPNGTSVITGATKGYESLVGKDLGEVWDSHRELFGDLKGDKFPLLVKIIDADDWLSLQVHPSDELAPEGELGKAECWLVLHADEGAQLVHGIKETNLEAAKQRVLDKDFDDFFVYHDVKAGDFFDVPHGLVHGIGPGITILEVQQNSDTTYRLYDWDRPGLDGKLRPLHIKESAECLTVDSHIGTTSPQIKTVEGKDGSSHEEHFYVSNDYFSMTAIVPNSPTGTVSYPQPNLLIVVVIEGSLEFSFDGGGAQEVVTLDKGQACVVTEETIANSEFFSYKTIGETDSRFVIAYPS